MKHLRPLSGLFLALLLCLASVPLAVARVQPPMAQWVELCGQDGPLAIDAQGRPVGSPHLCPDCVAAGGAAFVPPAVAMPLLPRRCRGRSAMITPLVSLGQGPQGPWARGPPIAG